jgi:drug/metabolite transporter (DMT)-like permease
MGAVLGVEAISIHKLGGILCSVAGAMIVTIYGESKSSGTANNMVLGVTFIVMNVCGMAAYFVLSKAVVKDHPPVTVMASSFLIATIAVFIVALCSVGFDLQVWAMNYDPVNYACLAYAVFLAATYNYCVLAWANKKTSPTTVTSYTTLQPLTAVVISSIFLGTHPTPAQSCGGCAIVAGLLLNIYAQILQDKEQNNQESKSLLASSKKETA